MQSEKDEILMQRLQEGITSNLGVLYTRYKIVLLNYFINVTQDYQVSNDLLMELFERIYKYRNSFDPSKKFKSWLYQMSNNLLKDHFKKSSRLKSIDTFQEEEAYEEDFELQQNFKTELLKKAMAQLPVSERKVISMYYLLEIPYCEIAQIEGASVNSIRIRVCRALKNLNTIITNSGIKEL